MLFLKPGSRLILSGIVVVLILGLTAITAKAYGDSDKKAILMVADRLSFEELGNLPGFKGLIKDSAIALMNNRPSGAYSACKGYINIGSGTRAEGTPSAVKALEVKDNAADLFFCHTGHRVEPGMVVNPGINKLIDQNLKGEYDAAVGSIGYYLHRARLKTAVLGNCDCGDTQIRWAVSIAMDRRGIVDYGVVGERVLKEDCKFPTGLRTDYTELIVLMEQMLNKADFIVVETGDLTRIEENKELLDFKMYENHRQKTLLRIDGLVKWIKEKAETKGWLFIIAVPYAAEENISRGARLTPVMVYGDKFVPGLLTSGTTRRAGIVGGIDIAPTVLDYFNLEAKGLTGRPLEAVPTADNLVKINELNQRIIRTSNFRQPVLYNYAIFVIIVILAGLFIILYPRLLNKRIIALEEAVLLFIMAFPVALLMLPLIKLKTLASTVAVAIVVSAGVSAIAYKFIGRIEGLFLFISGLTAALLISDIITGGEMIKNSLLGYDAIIGARYYGIGNEYMGIATGSVIIFASSLLELRRSFVWVAIILLSAVVFVVGYPGLGANLGGAITCFFTFVFFMLRVLNKKVGVKQCAAAGVLLVVVLLVFLTVDTFLLKDYSHIAAAAQKVADRGPAGLTSILRRKIAMNLKLFRYTVWTKVLVTVIAVTGVLFYRPVGIFKTVFEKYPVFAKGWSALAVAAAVGMAVNDSGIVASATSSIFFITSMLYIVIQERKI